MAFLGELFHVRTETQVGFRIVHERTGAPVTRSLAEASSAGALEVGVDHTNLQEGETLQFFRIRDVLLPLNLKLRVKKSSLGSGTEGYNNAVSALK